MVRWFSLTKILTTTILGLALFAAFRSGWMPVEFGGTQTGSMVDSQSGFQTLEPSGDVSPVPGCEVDDGPRQVDIGGDPRERPVEQTHPITNLASEGTANRRGTVARSTSKWDELADVPDEPDSRNTVQPAVATGSAGPSRSRLR